MKLFIRAKCSLCFLSLTLKKRESSVVIHMTAENDILSLAITKCLLMLSFFSLRRSTDMVYMCINILNDTNAKPNMHEFCSVDEN